MGGRVRLVMAVSFWFLLIFSLFLAVGAELNGRTALDERRQGNATAKQG